MARDSSGILLDVPGSTGELSLEDPTLVPRHLGAPADHDQLEGKVVPLRPRSRWEDYLPAEPVQRPGPLLEPVPPSREAVSAPWPPLLDASPPPVPAALRTGPFEIPTLSVTEVRPPLVGQLRLSLAAVLGLFWLLLSLLPSPSPVPTPAQSGVARLSPGTYARYRLPVAGVPSRWVIQLEGRMLVMVDSRAWRELPSAEQRRALEILYHLGEAPEELLVLGEKSELLAEVHQGGYHLYV